MQVDGVNPGNAYGWRKVGLKEPEPEPQEPIEQPVDSEVAEVTEEEPEEAEGEKGVLRLLEQGHFKGVSDVRLRINFFDELTAVRTAQVEAAAEEKVAAIVESVGAGVDSFLMDNELTQEQADGLQQLQDSFAQAANETLADPVIGLRTAFADFLETLMNLFEPPPDDAGPDSQALITNLQFAFFAGMDELTEALSSVKILPELSEPSGNGVAYEKFVAIYNEMRGVSTTGDEPEPEPTEPPE